MQRLRKQAQKESKRKVRKKRVLTASSKCTSFCAAQSSRRKCRHIGSLAVFGFSMAAAGPVRVETGGAWKSMYRVPLQQYSPFTPSSGVTHHQPH